MDLHPAADGDNVEDRETTASRIEPDIGRMVDRRLQLGCLEAGRYCLHEKSSGSENRANDADNLGLLSLVGIFGEIFATTS